jgi:hypothetical protein
MENGNQLAGGGVSILVLLVVLGTSVWVYFDATKIGLRKTGEKAKTGKFHVDMGPVGWMVCCLLLWIVAFPAYILLRPGYTRKFQPVRESASPIPCSPQANQLRDFDEQLRKLAKLKSEGLVSEEEFGLKKKELLGL